MFNLFKSLFGGKGESFRPLNDYSDLIVDMHSHLIPGIDDGAKTMDDSIAMLRQFEALGYKKVITTPHIVTGGYDNTPEIITKGRDKVREAIAANGVNLQFDAAAEYYADESMLPKIEKSDILTIGNNYVLIEFSFLAKTRVLSEVMYKLQAAGYKIILAHPERYPYMYGSDLEEYKSLCDKNVFLQLNILSLQGKYGAGAKAFAEKMIDANLISFLATDLHNIRQMEMVKEGLNIKHLNKLIDSGKLLNKTLL